MMERIGAPILSMAIVVALATTLAATRSHACSCDPIDPKVPLVDHTTHVDLIFEGKILARSSFPQSVRQCTLVDHDAFDIEVHRVWKGCVPETIQLQDFYWCDVYGDVGDILVFWAYVGDDGIASTSMCAGVPASPEALDLALGEATPPQEQCDFLCDSIPINIAEAPIGGGTDENNGDAGTDDATDVDAGAPDAVDAGAATVQPVLFSCSTSSEGGASLSLLSLTLVARYVRRRQRTT